MKTLSWSGGIGLLTIAVLASSAGAETVKCQRTIAKENAKFLQARIKILSKCEGAVVKDGGGSCPEPKTTESINKAKTKMANAVAKTCGGVDKICGVDLTGEDNPGALGWPANCPSFESKNSFAGQLIKNCGDIVSCLTSIDDASVDQAIDLYYDDILPTLPTTGDLNKCQISIGKAASAFLISKSKALQKCWDARLNGKHSNSCAPPAVGDGKYLNAIAKAEDKKIATICKACGGTDKACGGAADRTPLEIGFPPDCPAVTIPGSTPGVCNGGTNDAAACSSASECPGGTCGGACARPISTLQDIIDCVDCVTEFKADCADRSQVPQFAPYPSECKVCTAPTPTGPCPTTLQFTADGPNVDLDAGWTGLGHDATVPTNGRITLAVSGCAGVSQPTCGQCNVSGPLANTGGPEFDTRRCLDASWIKCTSDLDCTAAKACTGGSNTGALCTVASECPGGSCTNAGYTGPCIYFVGAPLPLVTAGVTTCLVDKIDGSVSGTINITDGTSTTNVPLQRTVYYTTSTEFAPCPNCVGGTCTNGPRFDQLCSVNGTGLFGDVSLDCPPNPGSAVGTQGINLNIATGTQLKTLSVFNPTCRQTGYTGLKCFCDTCNNGNAEACSTNADCPDNPPLTPGICGGRRCIGGFNSGAPCSNTSACPGGAQCNRPGEPTQPNACLDDTSTPEVGCLDAGNNEGVCADGPVEQNCSIQTFRSCATAADCAPSVTCPECLPDQACIGKYRECFVDNGIVGNSVTVSGNPDAPCAGTAKPTVGAFFCVAPVSASAVNAAGGLPGLGRIRIPSTTTLSPWN